MSEEASQEQCTFAANWIGWERYVWHKSIHERHEERCYYMLFRFSVPVKDLVDITRTRLEQCKITSSCVYPIFGYFDLLVRIWATRVKLTRFITLMDTDTIHRRFEAEEVNFHWDTKPLCGEGIRVKHQGQIEQLARQAIRNEPLSDTIVSNLLSFGIISKTNRIGGSLWKFYIALGENGQDLIPKETEGNIDKFFRTSEWLDNVSIYRGSGFATYMVKAVVREYRHVNDTLTKYLANKQVSSYYRPTTYLIADCSSYECDLIDVDWKEPRGKLSDLLSMLGPEYTASIGTVSEVDIYDLELIMTRFSHLYGTAFDPYFKRVFVAKLTSDTMTLSQSMVFYSELDRLLRQKLIEIASIAMGASWYQELQRDVRVQNSDLKEKPPGKYTLSDARFILGLLSARNEQVKKSIVDALGEEDWDRLLQNFIPIRNMFAHGTNSDDLIGSGWRSFAQDVFGIGRVYNNLKGAID